MTSTDGVGWGEFQEREDMCIHMAGSLCSTTETIFTQYCKQLYPYRKLIFKKRRKKKKKRRCFPSREEDILSSLSRLRDETQSLLPSQDLLPNTNKI